MHGLLYVFLQGCKTADYELHCINICCGTSTLWCPWCVLSFIMNIIHSSNLDTDQQTKQLTIRWLLYTPSNFAYFKYVTLNYSLTDKMEDYKCSMRPALSQIMETRNVSNIYTPATWLTNKITSLMYSHFITRTSRLTARLWWLFQSIS